MSVQPVGDDDDKVDFVEPLPPTSEELDELDLIWLERLAKPWRPTERQPFRPVRCTGVTRNGVRAGRQCPHAAVLGTNVCHVHGAQLPVVRKAAQARVEQARLRLINSADDAVQWLLELGENSGSDAVRLKASTEILDRAGVRGGTELDVALEVTRDPSGVLKARLEKLRERVVDGAPVTWHAALPSTPAEADDTVSLDDTTPLEPDTAPEA